MAKKHKLVKPSRSFPTPTSPVGVRIPDTLSMVALGAAMLALIGGVLAVYGSVAKGDNFLLHAGSDQLSALNVLRDMLGESGYDVSGWSGGVAPMLFPDYLVLFAGYFAGLNGLTLLWFCSVFLIIISTIGWVMVADKVLGRSALVWAFAVLTTALHLIVMSFGTADVFVIGFFALFHHNGLWAFVPYLLWLLLSISESSKPSIWQTAVFAILLGLLLFSDVTVIVWFVVPATGVLLFAYFVAPARTRGWQYLLGALVVAYLIRRIIASIWPLNLSSNTQKFTSFNIDQSFTTLAQLFSIFGDFAVRYPIIFFCWLMFFVLLLVALIAFLRTVRLSRPKRDKRDLDNLTLVILFFALSATAAPAAAVLTGTTAFVGEFFSGKMRYLYPSMFLPLFAGWVCLLAFLLRVFPFFKILTTRQIQLATVALSFLLAAGAAPKVMALVSDTSRLRIFDAPFFNCVQEVAQRRTLRAGVASFLFDHPIAAASYAKEWGIKGMARIGNLTRLGYQGKHSLYVSQDTTNRHYEQGEFDFAVVNAHNGKVYLGPWSDKRNRSCEDKEPLSCIEPAAYGFIIDGTAVEKAFGKPSEIVDCEVASLYLYDTPFSLQGLPRS